MVLGLGYLLFFGGLAWPAVAQQNLQELILARQLDSLQAELSVPLEHYRTVNRSNNSFLACPYALYSRKDKLEIRFYLEPDRRNLQEVPPQVKIGRMAAHLSSNDENSEIRVYGLSESLLDTYGADWGKVLYFVPKRSFSIRKYCELIVLYRENRGTAYTVLLYDKENPEVRRREQMIRFKE